LSLPRRTAGTHAHLARSRWRRARRCGAPPSISSLTRSPLPPDSMRSGKAFAHWTTLAIEGSPTIVPRVRCEAVRRAGSRAGRRRSRAGER
jgi:hypothetical protein